MIMRKGMGLAPSIMRTVNLSRDQFDGYPFDIAQNDGCCHDGDNQDEDADGVGC